MSEQPYTNLPYDMPNAARIYDYLLGGFQNFEADRKVGQRLIEINPEAPMVARANRFFLRRVVSFLVRERGIEQFLDLGSGIPSVGNVHEVAQRFNPSARVVYVDFEPVAVYHSKAILQGNTNATVIQADARQAEFVLNHPETRRLLDFEKPLAVLLFGFLHFVTDDEEVYELTRALSCALAVGSYLCISHLTDEGASRERVEQSKKLFSQTATPIRFRSYSQIKGLFEGLELVDPGLVYVPLWQSEDPGDMLLDQPDSSLSYGGVGRKP